MEANTHLQDGELPGITQPPSVESLISEVNWDDPASPHADESVAAETPPEDAAPADDAGQPDAAREQEELARQHGWVEKEKWHGKGQWVDAATFNARREAIMPHVLREAKTLREEVRAEREARMAAEARLAQLEKHAQEQQAAAASIQFQTLMAQKAQAESEGDFQTANKIGDQLLDLKLSQKIPLPRAQQPQQQGVNPQVQRLLEDFTAQHPEYKDQGMQTRLAEEAFVVKSVNPTLSAIQLLDRAHERVQEALASRTRNTRAPMAEMNGAPSRAMSAKRGYADLTQAEAQKAQQFFNTTPMFKKLDQKALAAAKQDYLANLPPSAFRR